MPLASFFQLSQISQASASFFQTAAAFTLGSFFQIPANRSEWVRSAKPLSTHRATSILQLCPHQHP